MKTFEFDPGLSFTEARKLMTALNHTDHKHSVARLTWLEGNQINQTLTYRYDKLAERFGHEIDKEGIDVEIVSSLLNAIPVRVEVAEQTAPKRRR